MNFQIQYFIAALLVAFTSQAADLSSSSELKLENLKVVRAEMPDVFESVLVLVRDDMKARVTVTCVDGFGPLQSTIVASFIDSADKVQTRVFSGADFYCYGAGKDLAARMTKGQMVNLSIKLDVQSSPPKVLSVSATSVEGGDPIVSKRNSTVWFER